MKHLREMLASEFSIPSASRIEANIRSGCSLFSHWMRGSRSPKLHMLRNSSIGFLRERWEKPLFWIGLVSCFRTAFLREEKTEIKLVSVAASKLFSFRIQKKSKSFLFPPFPFKGGSEGRKTMWRNKKPRLGKREEMPNFFFFFRTEGSACEGGEGRKNPKMEYVAEAMIFYAMLCYAVFSHVNPINPRSQNPRWNIRFEKAA